MGDGCKLWDDCKLGDGCKLGDDCKLWNGCVLGNGCNYKTTPAQVFCHPYLVYPYSLRRIGVGCVVHDIEYWMRSEDPKELADHLECQPWSRYRAAIALVAGWIEGQKTK